VIKIADGIMYEEKKGKVKDILGKIWSVTTPGIIGALIKKGGKDKDTEREQAILYLRQNGKAETEENIQKVIEHSKEQGK